MDREVRNMKYEVDTTYELQLTDFSGPIEKLLELIEGRKMEITRLSLAEVTADFFKYIDSLEEVSPKVLADFIIVAAKLILIKSHTLLPELKLEEEEEKEIAELQNRLKFYREFRRAENSLKEIWQKKVAFGRAYLAHLRTSSFAEASEGQRRFYLSQEVKPADLREEIERIASRLLALAPEVKREEIKLVTLEEKLSELLDRLDRTIGVSFNNVAEGREKSEVIVLFLALLHLLKYALVKVEQEKLFSEIKIAKS